MKPKSAILFFLAVLLLVPSVLYAESNCVTPQVVIDKKDNANVKITKIKNALQNPNLIPGSNDSYQVCFEYAGFIDSDLIVVEVRIIEGVFNGTFALQTNNNVEIVGLKIRKKDDLDLGSNPLVRINTGTNGQVTLKGVEISNVVNGINIEGGGAVIFEDQSKILCDASKSGIGINILSNNSTVRSAEISGCGEGMRIAGSSTTVESGRVYGANTGIAVNGDHFSADGVEVFSNNVGISLNGESAVVKNSKVHTNAAEGIHIAASSATLGGPDVMNRIHDNGIGINHVSGSGDRWGFNKIYSNTAGLMSVDGIAPTVVLKDGYALSCSPGADGKLKRELEFYIPNHPKGRINLFLSSQHNNQGENLIGSCDINESGVCDARNVVLTPPLTEDLCGREFTYVTAIFTPEDVNLNSTKYVADSFEFYSPTIASITAPSLPFPVETGVQNPAGGAAIRTNNEERMPEFQNPIDDPATIQSGGKTEIDSGSSMQGGGGVTGYGVDVKASCSLNALAEVPSSGALNLIFLLLPLVGIFGRRSN